MAAPQPQPITSLDQVDDVTRRWIRNVSDERAALAGCRFEGERGQFVVEWIERYCKLYEGDWGGQPMKLLPWAHDATMRLFGWVKWSKKWGRWVRRFRQASIWIAKKNGKSPVLAAWGMYLLCGDGEPGAKVFLAAKDGTQARDIAGKHAFEMLRQSPKLQRECSTNQNLMQITHEPSRSILRPLSSANSRTQESKEGINGSVMVDECFVAGTKILTPFGLVSIDDVRPGDMVYNAFGEGVVLSTIKRNVTELCHLEYSDGASIFCTAKHPVFTERAWIEAGELAVGALAYRQQDVQALLQSLSSASVEEQGWANLCSDGEVLDGAGVLLDILRQESGESDVCRVFAEESVHDVETDGAQAAYSWREWQAVDGTASRSITSSWDGLGTRVANSNDGSSQVSTLPDMLQSRYRKRGEANCYRSGWRFAQQPQTPQVGCQENSTSGQPWLVRISRIECKSPVSVFNLHVSGHPSYFANGVLVHNCHVIDREFVNRISRAGISRSEPLQIEVSTAGNNPDGYGKERFDYACKVEKGEVTDQDLFTAIYAAPQDVSDADLDADPLIYGRMSNPSFGFTVDEEEYLADYARSKASASKLAEFKMYRLNIWQHAAQPWLKTADWERCRDTFTLEDLAGLECYGGLDLSKTRDMSAFALVFPVDENEKRFYRLLTYFWLPEESLYEIGQNPSFRDWVKQGYLEVTPGNVIDYRFIKRRVGELAQQFNIMDFRYDPRFAEQVTQEIEEEFSVPRVSFGQSINNYTEATTEFEKLVIAGDMRHNGNPVMSWQVGHVTVRQHPSGGMLPVKPPREDPKKIDGVIAAVLALAGAMKHVTTAPSVSWM